MSALSDLVRTTEAVLLDFDGPVCSVFSGRPNYVVATRLRSHLAGKGVTLPSEFDSNRDPLELLRWVGRTVPDLVGPVDDLLTSEETTAVLIARPTSSAHEVLQLLADRGTPTAIVSNNSERAIAAYLDLHNLTGTVRLIVGREHSKPDRMKPEPDAVIRAVQGIGKLPKACLFVGDSTTDITAGKAAGVRPIGYAKADRYRPVLATAGAELVIDDMSMLVRALEAA